MSTIKKFFLKNKRSIFLISIFNLAIINVSHAAPWNEFIVKSNGNTIGKSYIPNGTIFSAPGYYFTLVAPNDGVSTAVQVGSQKLYYTTSDCSGDAYISNDNTIFSDSSGRSKYFPGSISGGNIFVGYSDINTKSLFYVSRNTQFSQLKALSYRDNNNEFQELKNVISFKDTANWQMTGIPKSGYYILNFGGYTTEPINWNDTNEQIRTKIITGIPIIAATQVQGAYFRPNDQISLHIRYQTAQQNILFNFTVTNNTIKNGRNDTLIPEISMVKTIPGTCVKRIDNDLNMVLTKVLPNESSITGLSNMEFPQPITYE